MALEQVLTDGSETGNTLADKINGIINLANSIEGKVAGFDGDFLGFAEAERTSVYAISPLSTSYKIIDAFGVVTRTDPTGDILIDPSLERVVISSDGVYEVAVSFEMNSTTTFRYEFGLFKNGIFYDNFYGIVPTVSGDVSYSSSAIVKCVAGDILSIGVRVQLNSNNYVSIEKSKCSIAKTLY